MPAPSDPAPPEPESSGGRGVGGMLMGGVSGFLSKIKNVASSPKPAPLEANPITHFYELGDECSTAGPGLAWTVHHAYRKSDGKECSVFVLQKAVAEKMYKPTKQKKEKELMLDCIRKTVRTLHRVRHPKMLQIMHPLEEGATTLAFAAEPVLASLHDILAWQEESAVPGAGPPPVPAPAAGSSPPPPLVGEDKPEQPPKVKNYWFLDMEIRFGLLQIIDALNYVHSSMRQVHRNVSPHAIIVTQRGTWKLFGLDFVENIVSVDPTDMMNVPPYSMKIPKVAQPHLDYMAPEAQINGQCNILSDMFSLGLVICAVFNGGRPLLRARNNPLTYIKQMEHLAERLQRVLVHVPGSLREAVARLLSKEPQPRPTTQLLPLIKYFKCSLERCTSEPAIDALQVLDNICSKDAAQRSHFYSVTLLHCLPHIPEKLVWMAVWPALAAELRGGEALAAALVPAMWLAERCEPARLNDRVLPVLRQVYCRNLMTSPKSAAAAVAFLERMAAVVRRGEPALRAELLPLLLAALGEGGHAARRAAALTALHDCADFLPDETLGHRVLPAVRAQLERAQGDVKVVNLVLRFYEKVLERLERSHVVEQVIPTMLIMKLADPDTIARVVKLYKKLITEQKFEVTSDIMACKMIPSLAPQAVNPGLSGDQYNAVIEILYELLDRIDVIQRAVLARGGTAGPAYAARPVRHRRSIDDLGRDPPPFNIPNLRVERERKTSSAEDMARRGSAAAALAQSAQSSVGDGIKKIGQWFFGSNNSTNSNNDNRFLRVASNVFPNRRLSDNTLLAARARAAAAPSSSSTPGSAAQLPARRHSSIGPQERRGSHLSPPTAHGRGRGGSGSSLSVPAPPHRVGAGGAASTSVPFLGASATSMLSGAGSRRASAAGSRRPSAASRTSAHSAAAGLVAQLHGAASQLFGR